MTQQAILVVEDDPNIVSVLVDVLEGEGYHVSAPNPKESVAVAQEEQPLLILLDLLLPGETGMSIAHRLRGNIHTRHIPIVLMTASSENQIPATIPHDDTLSKPFDLDDLLVVVERVKKH